ncbi:1-deoxy-D-xylulose-5-phosphate synthase [Actinorhabdospora filicis]|uniref:1-deoxy-D-xylulose-5-phosphate synthase n=2 Tax=Actinorhabdospora filicis TaxID=1785913 RepID=A0A9W6SIY0_9ACTN|nr:1-deoxy-D-xylulose-5-phosphate synthase [Actinorhabdospora filicis]
MDVPGDATRLRDMSTEEAHRFAGRLREFLIDGVCATGGHLGPNLGVVELTIALHRVFDSPADTLLFDTGHQAYVHKILTGRAAGFARLRQTGGLSGYPSRRESPHDHIENSHASTALSYADGIAKGRHLRGESGRAVVAVIGDGALTGGMAWEALNNIAAAPSRPVIVVLNDNGRSYAPTVGGLAEHLAALGEGASGNVFADLGLAYLGPVDGHDIAACEDALRAARDLARPVVVHCRTEKGRGYAPARGDDAELMHAVGVLDPATGTGLPAAPTWTDVFAEELVALGEAREDIVAITAAMPGPTGTALFGARFPGRFFDVGIAEQHAVTSAAGLAMAGLHPVVAIYSTFLSRAFDQVLMDVALHRLPVTFVLDRAGITGPDGPSHHGMWDPALLACVPGLRLAAPRDATRLRELLREAAAIGDGPTALRFPKAAAGADVPAVARIGELDVLHRGRRMPLDVLIVSYGALAPVCLAAAAILEARGIGVTVVDPRWSLPVDPGLAGLAARHRYAVTVTDASRAGGPGGALARACADAAVRTPVRELGLPGAFIEHGPRPELLAGAGLSAEAIASRVLADLDTGIEPVRAGDGVSA